MKNEYPWRLILGIGLVLVGGLALLQSLGLGRLGDWAWTVLFGMGGLAFLMVTLRDRRAWWGLIPGLALLGIGGEIFVSTLPASLERILSGVVFVAFLSASFWLIYLLNPRNWWAIIPGGTLATISLVAALSNLNGGLETGGIFMMGLGITFGLVALLTRQQQYSMRWAWIPAAILFSLGLLIFFAALDLTGYIFGVALIAVGGYLAYQSLKK
ncbi:MAG: hypothetical protein KA988_04470 [Longilinea sp.]|nr:hypothetical protein [Longilinea sp.]MCA1954885.1 hypothetical protein [Anaerolinea sp.]